MIYCRRLPAVCLVTIIMIAGGQPGQSFDSRKFPGRGKLEAFNRSCAYDKKGIALEEQGKPKEAIEQYKKAIAIYPYFAVHFSNYANALADLHRYSEAVAQYQKAVELAPDFAAAYSNMADALSKQKNYREAERACKNALRVDPGYVPAMTNLAEVFLAQARPKEARTVLSQARGLTTTAAMKKIIAADLEKAEEMLGAARADFPVQGKNEMPR
jgi:tetratricopeptide (TPR) repeat protein